MTLRPIVLSAVLVLGLAGLSAIPVRAQDGPQTLRLDHDIAVDLPEQWTPDDQDEAQADEGTTFNASGFRRVHVTCNSQRCKGTQEVCTFLLQKEPVEGADDAARIAGLYDSALSKYVRVRAVLAHSAAGATIHTPLAKADFGSRTWWVIETQAPPGYKSGLFAETVIGGWYLGAICKTCETTEERHQGAREMLSTARGPDEGGS